MSAGRRWPTRPTFGINLAPIHPLHTDEVVWRPTPTGGGTIPRAQLFDSVPGFAAAILDTMQNWADNKQVTLRGYADRVVEIRLSKDEGGMNLRMPTERIMRLVGRGAAAGDELLEFDWEVHRVIRYRTAMARLNDALSQLRAAWAADEGDLYQTLLEEYSNTGTASSFMRGVAWREADRTATEALIEAIDAWASAGWPALANEWPVPSPVVRMAPR